MKNLIEPIPRNVRIAVMIGAAAAVVWLSLEMNQAMQPAVDDSAFGIVSFELAGTVERATEILDDWGPDGRAGVERAIQLDYGFLIAYAVLLVLASSAVAIAARTRAWVKTEQWGWRLAALVLVAALLDAVENTLLLQTLGDYISGSIGGLPVAAAAGAAAIKFAIVVAAIAYVGVGLIAVGVNRR